jgi:hypothetical protein
MPKNDFTAQAGISLEQWEKDIATMTGSLDKVSKSSEKTAGILKRIANTAIVAGAIKMFSDFGNALLQTGRKAGQIDDEFTALYGNIRNAGDAGLSGADKLKAAFMQIPKVVGLKNIHLKELEDMYAISAVIDEQNGGYEQMIAKLTKLNNLRSTETAKPQSEQGDTNLARINAAIDMTSQQAVNKLNEMTRAQQDLSAGQQGRLKDLQLENQYKDTLSDIDQKLKDSEGQRSDQQEKAYKSSVALAKAQYDQAVKENALSTMQEGNLAAIAGLVAKTGISFADQNKLAEVRIGNAKIEFEFAKATLGVDNARTKSLGANLQQLKLAKEEFVNQHKVEIEAAKNKVSALDSELTGNKLIADLEKNRAAYALQIAEARRHENRELEKALLQEQALSRIQILMAQERKTPRQRAAERKEQDAQNQAERKVLRREIAADDEKKAIMERRRKFGANKADEARLAVLNQPDHGIAFADGRNHRSKITDEMRADFLRRIKANEGGAGGQAGGIAAAAAKGIAAAIGAAMKHVPEIKTNIMTVTAVKSKSQ